jgi:heat shock protein HslJ
MKEKPMFHKITQSKFFKAFSLLLLVSLLAVGCVGGTSDEPITDVTWQWASLSETEPASLSVTPDPENYTLTLKTDGTLSIKADCNMVMGTYELDGNAITIVLGPSTMAYCGEQSLDVQYLQLLSEIGSYRMEEGQLVLELKNDAGEMTFQAE